MYCFPKVQNTSEQKRRKNFFVIHNLIKIIKRKKILTFAQKPLRFKFKT